MERLEQLQLGKSVLENQIIDLQYKIDRFELEEGDYIEEYDDLIDECGLVYIGGVSFLPSQILCKLDPVAYNCGLSDYIESIDLTESEEYNQLTNELEELEQQLNNYEREINKIEFEELDEFVNELNTKKTNNYKR